MTKNIRRTFGATLAGSALLVGGAVALPHAAGAAPAAAAVAAPTHAKVRNFTKVVALEAALLKSTQRLCRYEDGSGSALPCRWDARRQGNGHGVSYVVVYAGKTKKGATKVIYVYADHDERGRI